MLDEAHHAGYDFSNATKVLDVGQELKLRYARIFTREVALIYYGSRRRWPARTSWCLERN
jgi:hypothetical protein